MRHAQPIGNFAESLPSIQKITRRIKRTLQKSIVEHNVAERQKWAKFGAEKGKKAGPDPATTTVVENVALKLSAGNKVRNLSIEPTLKI